MNDLTLDFEYLNTSSELVKVYFDEEQEVTLVINFHKKTLKIFDDFKNMLGDVLEHINNDIEEFNYINPDLKKPAIVECNTLFECEGFNSGFDYLKNMILEF